MRFKIIISIFLLLSLLLGCHDSKHNIERRKGFLSGLHVRLQKIGFKNVQTGYDDDEAKQARANVYRLHSANVIRLRQAGFLQIMKSLGFEYLTLVSLETKETEIIEF